MFTTEDYITTVTMNSAETSYANGTSYTSAVPTDAYHGLVVTYGSLWELVLLLIYLVIIFIMAVGGNYICRFVFVIAVRANYNPPFIMAVEGNSLTRCFHHGL